MDATGSLSAGGYTAALLDGMLDPNRWDLPNPAVIGALTSAAALGIPVDASLAPKLQGTNIEGLARLPSPSHPAQLAIGFRNPRIEGKAIVVTLTDGDAALGSSGAHFGTAFLLDLGGLTIRSMAWSDLQGRLLLLGGDVDEGGPSRLFTWTGDPGVAPIAIADLASPSGAAAEAIVAWDASPTVDVLFDQGQTPVKVGNKHIACKDAPASARSFTRARVTPASGP